MIPYPATVADLSCFLSAIETPNVVFAARNTRFTRAG